MGDSMRSLYESILDDDDQAIKSTQQHVLKNIVDFFGIYDDKDWYIKDDKLYICPKKNSGGIYKTLSLYFKGDFVYNYSYKGTFPCAKLTVVQLPLKSLNDVYSENIIMIVDNTNSSIPSFLSHCKNCTITYISKHTSGLDNVIPAGNTIRFEGEEISKYFYEFSSISNLNLRDCVVVLDHSADLSSIKNLTCKELIIQRGSKFHKDDKHYFEIDMDGPNWVFSDYTVEEIEKFLDNNNIKSFGMVDAYIQYIDWITKIGNDYKVTIAKSGQKRVPKVR